LRQEVLPKNSDEKRKKVAAVYEYRLKIFQGGGAEHIIEKEIRYHRQQLPK